ncbi:hypothetical protein R3P38DRAFT_3235555 [Favolaschia claudopus]|uniref:S1-like domain-containing protein n=1 Tax=Favolaschia claudopus TaxID=2862362 RepID=A0AAV9ZED2_9AGAR
MSSSGSASRPLLARPNSRKVNIAPAASTGLASASLSLYDGVASAGRLAEQEALSSSSGHSYGQGNRISDHSSSVAPDVSSQLHSEIPDHPCPVHVPSRCLDNDFGPSYVVVPIEGSDRGWFQPPEWSNSPPQKKMVNFALSDYYGLLVWKQTSKVGSAFRAYDRELCRVLCFNGAHADVFAGVIEPEKNGMPVPAFPFLTSQGNWCTPQKASSWMHLREKGGPVPYHPPSIPSADALRTPPPNPFQAIVQNYGDDSEDEEAGSEADEDLHLRNPFPHEISTNVLSLHGKLHRLPQPLSLIARDISSDIHEIAYREVRPLAMARNSESLSVMFATTTDALYALGVFDRYLDPLATVRFESPDSFAESFNAGERWKDPGLDWSPLQSAVVVCAEEVYFCTNESGTSAAMPPPLIVSERHTPSVPIARLEDSAEQSGGHEASDSATDDLSQNPASSSVSPPWILTPIPPPHDAISYDQSLGRDEVQPRGQDNPMITTSSPPLSPRSSPVVQESVLPLDALELPSSTVSSPLSSIDSESEHESSPTSGPRMLPQKRTLASEETAEPPRVKRVKLVVPQRRQLQVDPYFGKSDTHEVLFTNGESWDAVYHAAFQYGSERSDRFALAQILREKETGICSIHGRYGLLDTAGYIEEYAPCTEDVAIANFKEEYLQYTGHSWDDQYRRSGPPGNIRRPWGQYFWVGHSDDVGVQIYPVDYDERGR